MKNRLIIAIYILIALLTAAIIYVCMKPLVMVSQTVLLADAGVSGIVLSVLLFLLHKIIKYSHFSSLPFKQKIINYIALAILFVFCWLGTDYLFLHMVFPQEEWLGVLPTLMIRIVFSLLIYLLVILMYDSINEAAIQDDEYDVDETQDVNVEESSQDNVGQKGLLERIAVKNGQKIEVIPISDIIYLQAEGDYVMIYTNKGKFLKEQTMKSFERLLPFNKFVRVHRSNIVNVDFIAQIELYNKQSQLLKLKNGAQVKISLNGYKLLKQTLGL